MISRGLARGPSVPARVMSSARLASPNVAALIENMTVFPDGSLGSVIGPAPLVPNKADPATLTSMSAPLKGLFHGTLRGGAISALLLHRGRRILVFCGSQSLTVGYDNWDLLIGPVGSGAPLEYDIEDDDLLAAPTQFVQTSTGIVIIPQSPGRAFFYDGERIGFLGYAETPAAPTGQTAFRGDGYPNWYGYTGRNPTGNAILLGHDDFGYGQVGTFAADLTGAQEGNLLESRYQAAIQFIDQFGNVSSASARSEELRLETEPIISGQTVDNFRHCILWTNIPTGPAGTIGRILLHTKDMVNSGTADLFAVSGNAMGALSGAWATFPDNVLTKYHYNRADSTVLGPWIDAVPVPSFRVACVALGRLWIGGIDGDESAVIPSVPGRWGTFQRSSELYPDASGGAITALRAAGEVMLVFTASSTFAVAYTEDGKGWRSLPLSSVVGCVAPSSVVDLPGGSVMWLSDRGFYLYVQGKGVMPATEEDNNDIRYHLDRVNWPRAITSCAVFDAQTAEYRCWCPVDGADFPNMGFIFDTKAGGWRLRSHEKPRAVCAIKSGAGLVAGAGLLPGPSGDVSTVFVFDREHYYPNARPRWVFESGWIMAQESRDTKSPKYVYLWIEETQPKEDITVQVFRDYRKRGVSKHTYWDTATAADKADIPAIWSEYVWAQRTEPNTWDVPRPTWRRLDVFLPSCEVFCVRLTGTCRFRLLGWSFDESPHEGRKAP